MLTGTKIYQHGTHSAQNIREKIIKSGKNEKVTCVTKRSQILF